MRSTLTQLQFDVIKYERNAPDNSESKVYLSKLLRPRWSPAIGACGRSRRPDS